MATIYKTENKLRPRSKDRQKSLHLLIPAIIRDLMEFKANEEVTLEILDEQDGRTLKIYKKRE